MIAAPGDPDATLTASELDAFVTRTLADLLLVDGNPLEDLQLIADPGKNFVVIMKDGKIYKNALP